MARNPLIEAIHAVRYDLETCARHERAARQGRLEELLRQQGCACRLATDLLPSAELGFGGRFPGAGGLASRRGAGPAYPAPKRRCSQAARLSLGENAFLD